MRAAVFTVNRLQISSDRKLAAETVIARCQKLAGFSEDAGSTRRTYLSPPMRDCHAEIASWLAPLGVRTKIDAAGNLRAAYSGESAGAPRLLIGSHLDTVPNAGAYDGILGVVLAVALLESLDGKRLPFAIEVVGFSEEEGVRFRAPFIGSRALVGRLDEEFLERRDAKGISVRQAIVNFGLNPREISEAVIGSEVVGYLEFHIEQGPVLESLGLPLGVVEAIVGQNRLEFEFLGHANHAGTTPMHLRRDAVAAAAEWIGSVEKLAKSTPGLVATVGAIDVAPGATNVIAGMARLTLDVRHSADNARNEAVRQLTDEARAIAARRGIGVNWKQQLDQKAVAMNSFLVEQIAKSVENTGCKPHRMPSGAGHDAMILAEKIPTAMMFIRSPGGISHDPAETVLADDVAKAIECGVQLLDQLASSQDFVSRRERA